MRLTLGEVATVTAGALHGPADLVIERVVTDSRAAEPDSLFVALVAERDGHAFIPDARARGATASLVNVPVDGPHVIVGDTSAALGALGRAARARLQPAHVVGITGSTGKTSTKDLTAGALSAGMSTTASPASFNNEIGVPLTLLDADDDVDAVVVEMGARGRGHIAYLARLAAPTMGVITNIGVAHAELFGTVEETARAKGELLEALPPTGCAVLNADDAMTPMLAMRTVAPVLRAGRDESADVRIVDVALDDELRPHVHFATPWGTGVARLGLRGEHQAANAALALAVAGAAGVPLEKALAGLSGALGSRWRMEVHRTLGGVLVLNDAYNANPTSMAAALAALAQTSVTGRRWAVLGLMAELGSRSDAEHRLVGEQAANMGIDEVVVVGGGDAPALLAAAARAAGGHVTTVADVAGARALLDEELAAGDAVLVKASRVVGLEVLALALVGEDAA